MKIHISRIAKNIILFSNGIDTNIGNISEMNLKSADSRVNIVQQYKLLKLGGDDSIII